LAEAIEHEPDENVRELMQKLMDGKDLDYLAAEQGQKS
jgi:hypothetical protein